MRIFIIGLIIIITNPIFAQTPALNTVSPNGQFEIITESLLIGDASEQFTTRLVDRSSNDTIELVENLRHDFPAPNWFWAINSKYLIIEKSNYGNNSTIQIWDMEMSLLKNEIPGAIPVVRKDAKNYWDEPNEILIYYDLGNPDKSLKPRLMSLDLKDFKSVELKEFSNFFDLETPQVLMNKRDRSIQLNGETLQY